MRGLFITAIVTVLVAACGNADLSAARGDMPNFLGLPEDGEGAGGGGPGGSDGTNNDPTQPGSCKEGLPHTGFASADLNADRKPGGIGSDRRRVKPFSALRSEFQRAIGNVPGALAGSAAAFGDVPARWYSEPTAGAVSIYSTYTLGFTACYDSMTDAKFGQMPTNETATAECSAMQRKMWQRTATPDETKACVDHAMGLTEETVARRRWAHACASVVSAAGFTTY